MVAPTLKQPRQSAVEQFSLAGVTYGDRAASGLPTFAAFLRAALGEHVQHLQHHAATCDSEPAGGTA